MSELKPPRLLAGGIECSVSLLGLPQPQWHDIYMSIEKLSFYLTDAEITLRSDHLPLKKFLLKNTLNSKVNNWAVELETFNIKFEHISGIKNTLADTLSRIIKVDPEARP